MSDDRPFERLLRGAARRGRQAGPCPDEALLAAYADGGLSRGERAAVERHAADCARCAEHLALLASLDAPDSHAGRMPLWRGWKWLVPAATVVVVFTVWQRTGMRETEPPPREFAARDEGSPSSDADGGTGSDTSLSARTERRSSETAPEALANRAPAMPKEAPAARKSDAGRVASEPRLRAPQQGNGAGSAATPPAAQSRQPAPAATAPAPAPAPAPLLDESSELRRESASAPARSDIGASRQTEPAEGQVEAFARPQDIPPVVTAAPGVLLRLTRSGIERSTDAGAHWTTELADAPAPLRTLACASAQVCWAGGEQSLLLRRDASGAWTRRVLPSTSSFKPPSTSAAIVNIEATGTGEAVVSLSDGRRFRTADGGASWSDAGVRDR